MALDEMRGPDSEAAGAGEHRGEPVQHEPGAKEQPASWATRHASRHQQSRRDEVEGAQTDHCLEDTLLRGAKEHAGVNERHHQIAQAKGQPTGGKGGRDGDGDHQEAAHPDQQQQPDAELAWRYGVGQPRITPVHPPDIAEDQRHLEQTCRRRVLGEQAGQLGDGEDEDQIEEQFKRGDMFAAHGRAIGCLGSLQIAHDRIEVSSQAPLYNRSTCSLGYAA